MPKPRHHVLVCVNQRPAGDDKGCCANRGGEELAEQLKAMCKRFGNTVRVTRTRCLGQCARGANVVIYPDDVWYANVVAGDLTEIVTQHLEQGCLVKRLINPERS